MVFKKFWFRVSLSLFFILLNLWFIQVEFNIGEHPVWGINLIVLIIVQLVFFIRHINNHYMRIAEYLDYVKTNDASYDFINASMNSNLKRIVTDLDSVRQKILDSEKEQEIKNRYLEFIVNSVQTSMFAFDTNGRVDFINSKAKNSLHISYLSNLLELDHIKKGFSNFIKNLEIGKSEQFDLNFNGEISSLLFQCGEFRITGSVLKLVSFQNIASELDKKEQQSWSKIIRILNHEIMNSLTPIVSLSTTIKRYFVSKDNGLTKSVSDLEVTSLNRTVEGLEIIEERGKGLLKFVNDYRQLSALPMPEHKLTDISKLIQKSFVLVESQFTEREIEFDIKCDCEQYDVLVDPDQIQQVFINLLKNAIEAVPIERKPRIEIRLYMAKEKFYIAISDNGDGISNELHDEIFVPFFSTKEFGGGIGLSICKQIMLNHNGAISFVTKKMQGSIFTLEL